MTATTRSVSGVARARPCWWCIVIVIIFGAGAPRPPANKFVRLEKRGPNAWESAKAQPLVGLLEGGTTRLLVHAVADDTIKTYGDAVKAFISDVRMQGLVFNDVRDVDVGLATYMDDACFLREKGLSHGTNLYSGICHLMPEYKGHLPLAARSLVAWAKIANRSEGQPVPTEAIACIALFLIGAGQLWAALIVWLSEDCYMREQDWMQLCAEDVAADGHHVALLLGNQERGQQAKTGGNQGVIVDAGWLARILVALKMSINGHEQMFPLEVSRYRRLWWQAVEALRLDGVGPPHSLRHSKPSADAMSGCRTLEEIRRRGRWASVKSVQRYSKTHSLVAARAKIPEEIMKRGRAFLDHPERELCKAIQASPVRSSELASLVFRCLEDGALSCPVRTRTPVALERAGELSGMTVEQLKVILKEKGLSVKGRKALLVERIVAAG